ERGRFVTVFEAICQAVAYAHSKGVVHRDLKPGNVMVGAFGEVQVMDWGLAKVLTNREVADVPRSAEKPEPIVGTDANQSTGHSAADESTDARTQAGQVMGTPAYMAPEQARGEVDSLDARADVFSLGAVLCETLTSKPPYVGANG